MIRIAAHFGASAALLAIRTPEGRSRVFCWESGDGAGELSPSAALPVAEQALAAAADATLGWSAAQSWWKRQRLIGGLPAAPASPAMAAYALALAALVGKPRLLSIPLASPSIGCMRLVIAGESIVVDAASLDMLAKLAEQIGPSVENAWLRERLVSEASDTERARIGRDLHDSAIQPYIGLKFALEAVQRRAGPDNPVAPDLARLVDMATAEITTMREVISGLRGVRGKGGALLASAVRRQAARFGELFGIEVEVMVEGEMPVSRRIAGELFHIVAEGLSNIRRHTQARRACISLRTVDDLLVLDIRNENDVHHAVVADFVPLSLSQRAVALGGSVEVERGPANTTVIVRVPLPTSR